MILMIGSTVVAKLRGLKLLKIFFPVLSIQVSSQIEYAGLYRESLFTMNLVEHQEVKKMSQDKLLCIVQDADRLDAIGAIGIARCFTYGGKKGRPLYDSSGKENIVRAISKADYMSAGKNAPTIDHFYEKLLLLKDMMKTNAGKQIAEQRHDFMKNFLQQFSMEINGQA